ncbi:MAG: hypothetical protein J6R18_06370 [Kiritimatiellae bacterium]|nr:hypothetical protein [Kiritimatiellia bacterium]
MPIDYIAASLQPLSFDGQAPYSWDQFLSLMPAGFVVPDAVTGVGSARWSEIETQLRNSIAIARGSEKHCRIASSCDLYWQNRVSAAFQEKDPLKRETLIDRVWWDAAGELTPLSSPLSYGALETYALRLKIVLKRNGVSKKDGDAIFDKLTSAAEQ